MLREFININHELVNSHTNYIENAVIEGSDSEKNIIRRGISQTELNEYDNAKATFLSMTGLYPDNWLGWLGLYIISVWQSTAPSDPSIEKYKQNAFFYCPDRIKPELGNLSVYPNNLINLKRNEINQQEALLQQQEEVDRQYALRKESNKDTVKLFLNPFTIIGVVIITIIGLLFFFSHLYARNVGYLPILGFVLMLTPIVYLLCVLILLGLRAIEKKKDQSYDPNAITQQINARIQYLKDEIAVMQYYPQLSYYIEIMRRENM